jgi:hypothetical protein
MSIIIGFIASVTPERFLKSGTKSVNGEQVSLNIEERRDFLERNLKGSLDRFLDRYSVIRRATKLQKEFGLKRRKLEFHCLIGQVALTHAGIEQDLQSTLLVDWGTPDKIKYKKYFKKTERLHGRILTDIFPKILADYRIPDKELKEYEFLCVKLNDLNEKRNESLKATYAFDQDTGSVSKYNEVNFHNHDRQMSYEGFIDAWMPKVDLVELQKLYNDLVNLRQEFMNVRTAIFRDKIRLTSELFTEKGKSYPSHAFTNPYLYIESLKNSGR